MLRLVSFKNILHKEGSDLEQFSSQVRQRIVQEELEKMKKEEYISEDTYDQVVQAQDEYYINLAKEKALKSAERNENIAKKDVKLAKPVVSKQELKREKPRLSPQQVRERNITWALNLGVILLLIGGLVLATSTWDTLHSWVKAGLIGMVSLFFFGLAYFSERILKIEKTAFAFYVLGSLFLPIVMISIAYFELFGSYFSITGEGRYLFGAVTSLAILPIYFLLSVKLQARLFVWFSYITMSVFAGFFIAALYLPIDGFYLGIMLFNACLVIGYQYFRKKYRNHLFIKEFVAFIQANLILSTLLMLVFYNHELVHSFNLFLTALLYLAMIFVTNRKEYHFVFSIMLIYAAYQFIEFSVLHEISGIAYALLGMVFLGLPLLVKDDPTLRTVFRYTSAIVSACAFLYISLEGILLRFNEPSIVLLIAYLVISLNFVFLSNLVKKQLFHYLSPVFLVAGLYQAVRLSQDLFGYESIIFPMFLTGMFLYIVFGCYMKLHFLKHMKVSSRDIGMAVMGISILAGFAFLSWTMLGSMFALLSIVALCMETFEDRKSIRDSKVASWTHGITLGLAVVFYYDDLIRDKDDLIAVSGAEHFATAGIIVLLISFLWKVLKRDLLSKHSFFVANGFYVYGICLTFTFYYDAFMRSLIVFGGIVMAYLLYRRTKWPAMPYVVSGVTLLFYLTILNVIDILYDIQADLYHSLQFVMGAVLLLGIAWLIRNWDKVLAKGFWWGGHVYLPFSLLYSYIMYKEVTIWSFIVATIIYGLSLRKVTKPLFTKIFMYACFTSFWVVVQFALILLEFQAYVHYSLLVTSIVISVLWLISQKEKARIIAYYLVPFSIFGLIVFQLMTPYSFDLFLATLLYALGTLYVMHKENWDHYNVIPLLITFYALYMYRYGIFEMTLFALLLTGVGFLCYQTIYKRKNSKIVIDWYTIIGFFAMLNLYHLAEVALWTKLLPGLLISANLYVQRNRISYLSSKWMTFIAGAFLLQPYYTVLGNISIPALIERELYVLPWIVLAVFLKKITGQKHRDIANYIQWAVLVIVSLLLIQDGLASSTIYDALILGTLSLISMLAGMYYQMKSFFFVGAGVLLLNVFLQTRPYWGRLPWWAYLLIAGSILIAVASYHEWQKQKVAENKKTIMATFKEKVIDKIKKWD